MSGAHETFTLRETPRASDRESVRSIIAGSGFFYDAEVDVAVELLDEALQRGAEASGYHFVFADDDHGVAGYACFGPIAGTQSSFDLYWLAADPERRGQGIGSALLVASEARMAALGARRIYVETSSKALYVPTRGFYEARGYLRQAHLPDFYAPGDGKVIYVREVGGGA